MITDVVDVGKTPNARGARRTRFDGIYAFHKGISRHTQTTTWFKQSDETGRKSTIFESVQITAIAMTLEMEWRGRYTWTITDPQTKKCIQADGGTTPPENGWQKCDILPSGDLIVTRYPYANINVFPYRRNVTKRRTHNNNGSMMSRTATEENDSELVDPYLAQLPRDASMGLPDGDHCYKIKTDECPEFNGIYTQDCAMNTYYKFVRDDGRAWIIFLPGNKWVFQKVSGTKAPPRYPTVTFDFSGDSASVDYDPKYGGALPTGEHRWRLRDKPGTSKSVAVTITKK